MNELIEKIEVQKHNGSFYFTGILKIDPDDEGWVIIETTRKEVLRFRKEQIMQRKTLDTTEDDTNGRKRNQNISVR
jgi:hypothetical protein